MASEAAERTRCPNCGAPFEAPPDAVGEMICRYCGAVVPPATPPELAANPATPAAQVPSPSTSPAGGSGSSAGLIVAAAGTIIALLCLALCTSTPSSRPASSEDRFDPVVVPIDRVPGGVHAADADALLQLARAHAPPDAELTAIQLDYVSADGTVDLDNPSYRGAMEFEFASPPEAAAPEPARPIGAPPPLEPSGTHYRYHVDRRGLRDDAMSNMSFGPAMLAPRPIPMPHCTVKRIWKAARAAGAPANAVAQVTLGGYAAFTRTGWSFTILGTGFEATIDDATCTASGPADQAPSGAVR